MAELIYPEDGDPRPRPCPSWCILTQHFRPDLHIFADDGFHHDGPEIAVPTKDRMSTRGPETVVKVTVRAWTLTPTLATSNCSWRPPRQTPTCLSNSRPMKPGQSPRPC
jgi:hypothetical protein